MFEKASHGKLIWILIGVAYFFLMFGNGAVSLTHPDEVFYAQTAKEMLKNNEWLTPIMFDEPQFEKPILFYWLLMIPMKMFGLTSFAARMAPAVFGILGVLVTYWLAYRLFGDKRGAFLSGFVLATSFIYIALSRAVLTDMVFSILVVAALAFFYDGYVDKKNRERDIVLCFVLSGLAVLAKGVLGLLFVFVPVVLFLGLERDINYFRHRATFWGLLLFLLIAVPWHAMMVKMYGRFFIDEYWQNVHWRRILEAEHRDSDTFYFYPLTVIAGVFPWTLFLIPAIMLIYRRYRQEKSQYSPVLFLFCWVAAVMVGMQGAHSKLSSYIFPVFPAAAIVIGQYLQAAWIGEKGLHFKKIAYFSAGIVMLFAVAMMVMGVRFEKYIEHYISIFLWALSFVACALAVAWFVYKNEPRKATITLGVVSGVLLIGLLLNRGYAEPWVSCQKACQVLNEIDRSSSRIITSRILSRGVRFYTDRDIAVMDLGGEGFFSPHPVPMIHSDHEFFGLLDQQPVTYCVLKESNARYVREKSKDRYKITYDKSVGGKHILRLEKI